MCVFCCVFPPSLDCSGASVDLRSLVHSTDVFSGPGRRGFSQSLACSSRPGTGGACEGRAGRSGPAPLISPSQPGEARLVRGGLRAHVLEGLFPSEFGESSKVGDDIAVLGMEATFGGGTGTQSGIDIHGASRAKMRARKKCLASEVQASVVQSSVMLSSSGGPHVTESSKVVRSIDDKSGTAAGPSVSIAVAESAKSALVSTDFHGVKRSAKSSHKCDAPSHKTSSARVSSTRVPSEEDITGISADFHEVKNPQSLAVSAMLLRIKRHQLASARAASPVRKISPVLSDFTGLWSIRVFCRQVQRMIS